FLVDLRLQLGLLGLFLGLLLHERALLRQPVLFLAVARVLDHADDAADDRARARAGERTGAGAEAAVGPGDGAAEAADHGAGAGARGGFGRGDGRTAGDAENRQGGANRHELG